MQLEILTDDEQNARICADYWRQTEEGEYALKIREIATTHGMKPHVVSRFVEQHAFIWLEDICCGRCKQPYRFGTRSQYQERRWLQDRVCKACMGAERQAIADKKRDLILKMRQSAENNTPDPAMLDLTSKIYLLAVIQALGDENFSIIEPLDDYPACTLSPDFVYDHKVLRHLIDGHLLLICLDTRLEAVELQEDDRFSIDLGECAFNLALGADQITALINDFFDEETVQSFRQAPEFITLCKEVQLNECLGFLKTVLEEHQLYLSPGEKTRQVLSQCLEKFSVAQVYNFIWRAAKDAAAYYMRGSISKRQAANSVVGNISRNMERALANGWDVKPFNRNYSLPQSSLSRIIFNMVLGTDDGGFEYLLTDLLEEKEAV
ncbi:hypothetical protein R1T44_13125 [Cobetia amphilecti]|uniref:hypothetical protein n=1 Tax=Cobetia amphilecti TaxID=1055104 RepID=UPI002943DE15|nr:hypothetical protein [Cobetia amphilecti]WOI25074.1 hypothetical protein R1T44_13125 [Cobetia amphilecti]